MKNKGILLAGICIIIGFIYRLIPGHPHNVTPIAAMALIGGLYFNRKLLAFLVPIIALVASDLILNNTINRVFFTDHSGIVLWADYMYWTYGAFLLTVVLGIVLSNKSAKSKILVGGVAASLLFFVISNVGVWLSMPMYSKDFAGLTTCFIAAIPFFQNTLLGNLLFAGIFIGSIEYLRSRENTTSLNFQNS